METDIPSLFGAVGWLVDRTNQSRNVLSTVWLVRSQVAITCTHALIPYFDVPEALGVDFPHVGKRFAVKEILPHSYYDPWMVKRNYGQTPIYPPHNLAVETNNISALVLNPAIPPLEKSTVDKVARMIKRPMPEEESTLAGTATQLQITSIIQTLLSNRSNQGTLTLFDSNNNPVARFYLRENQLTHVRWAHLSNEEALFKLLTTVTEEEAFHFTFTYDYDPDWAKFPPIAKSTAGLLLDAYSRVETYQQILAEFNHSFNTVISQAVPDLNLDPLPLENRPAVACTWNHVRHGMPLKRLLKSCNFDGSTIMYALKYLRETGQISGRTLPPAQGIAPAKLNISNNCSLERGTPISSISLDPETRLPIIEMGFVLDTFPNKGDGHYVHSIGLPLSAAGAPLLVDGEVVGVHCGILTDGVEEYAEWIHPSLVISGEQVYQCLDLSPQKKTTEVLAFTPPNVGDRLTASGDPVDSMDLNPVSLAPDMASGWSRTSIAQEEYSGKDDGDASRQRRAEDKVGKASGENRSVTPAARTELTDTGSFKKKSGFFDAIGNMFKGKGTLESDTVELSLLRQGLDSEKFERIAANSSVRAGDMVRVRMRFLTNSYAAVLLKHGGGDPVRLIFPDSPTHEDPLSKGYAVEIPTQYTDASSVGRKKVYSGIPVSAGDHSDSIVVITGAQPLVVRLFELGPDRVFNYVTDSLGQELAGKFHVNRMEISRVADNQDSPNILTICVLKLNHAG